MSKTHWLIAALCLINFSIAAYFGIVILGGIPHIPDTATYIRQAILLSHGQLYVDNFTREPREAYQPFGTFIRNDKMFFQYNHFWPALLALPIKLGVHEFLNPLLSALSLLLIFLIARKLYDETTGCIAAIIYCFSPFAILMAGDYLTHIPTQFFLLLGTYFILKYVQAPTAASALIAGFSVGYAFNLRPLTSIGVMFPVGIYLLLFYRKTIFRKISLLFLLAFILTASLFFMDNFIVMGNPFEFIHPNTAEGKGALGLKNIIYGLNIQDAALGYLQPIIFHSFLPMLFFGIAFMPLITTRNKNDLLFFSIFLSLFAAYMLTFTSGFHGYGPRYIFEALFALYILAARGVVWITDNIRFKKTAIVFFAILLSYNIWGTATVIPSYENYNSIFPETYAKLASLPLRESIVITKHTWNWYEDGLAATLYDPTYTNTFFIRELLNGTHNKVLKEHPDKQVYLIASPTEIYPYNRSINASAG